MGCWALHCIALMLGSFINLCIIITRSTETCDDDDDDGQEKEDIIFEESNDDQRRPPSDTRPSFFGSQEKSSWSGDESSKVQPKACVLRQDYLLDWPHVMMSVNWLSVCRCRTLLELEQIKSHVFSFCLSACLVPSGGVCVCQNMYSKQVAAGASLLLYETFFVERGVVW